jgi:serine phosphatase RsbU (regulator of sigma subunit)
MAGTNVAGSVASNAGSGKQHIDRVRSVTQPEPGNVVHGRPAHLRADAAATHARILAAARTLARTDRELRMAQVAATAGVGRSTLYRHFPTRAALLAALDGAPASNLADRAAAGLVVPFPFQAPGRLGRQQPLALEVTRVLDEVPPYLVPDQLVAEARRASGIAVALYVIDIDGSHLLRLAGTEEFPDRIADPPALGPELIPEGLPELTERVQGQLPGCHVEPLWLRGRVIALMLCLGQPSESLDDLARQGAAALELAGDYTDFIEMARRRKPTTPAAEIQQNLFPPRLARLAGVSVAGGLLPSYAVGGDWFDYVENRDGAWLAIADAYGTGPTAAGLGAAALGSLRATRRSGGDLGDAVEAMHETVRGLGQSSFYVTCLLALWKAATSTLTWVNCGSPPPYLVDPDGVIAPLGSPAHPPLGTTTQQPRLQLTNRQLRSGERLVLVTDGIIERRMQDGTRFGEDGLRAAIAAAELPTAAYTAKAIQHAVATFWEEPLEDDATVVVMAVD